MTEIPTFPHLIRAIEIQLAFASAVALAAWAATSSKRVSATTKYWIWVATSINFVLPAGVLVSNLLETGMITLKDLKALEDTASGATGAAGRRTRRRGQDND